MPASKARVTGIPVDRIDDPTSTEAASVYEESSCELLSADLVVTRISVEISHGSYNITGETCLLGTAWYKKQEIEAPTIITSLTAGFVLEGA